MLAKSWKKFLLIILIIACLINIISKLTRKVSFDRTLEALKYTIQLTQEKITNKN